jgi:predicted Rossmann fold nucleotide-binding protein DprA/Smf involved in DNA uptake
MNRLAITPREYPEREIARIQRELDGLKSLVNGSLSKARREPSEAEVRAVLRARRGREAIFGKGLFADPAWDILLELYAAALAQRRVPISELAAVAGIPLTTALRWISKLESEGLVARENDPLDGRRVWVALTRSTLPMMSSFFDEVGPSARHA